METEVPFWSSLSELPISDLSPPVIKWFIEHLKTGLFLRLNERCMLPLYWTKEDGERQFQNIRFNSTKEFTFKSMSRGKMASFLLDLETSGERCVLVKSDIVLAKMSIYAPKTLLDCFPTSESLVPATVEMVNKAMIMGVKKPVVSSKPATSKPVASKTQSILGAALDIRRKNAWVKF